MSNPMRRTDAEIIETLSISEKTFRDECEKLERSKEQICLGYEEDLKDLQNRIDVVTSEKQTLRKKLDLTQKINLESRKIMEEENARLQTSEERWMSECVKLQKEAVAAQCHAFHAAREIVLANPKHPELGEMFKYSGFTDYKETL